jgi:hypothetical protein
MAGVDLHSLIIAQTADVSTGTLSISQGAARTIAVPEIPLTLQVSVAGVVVGDWEELPAGAEMVIDFRLADPSGSQAATGLQLTISPPTQAHPDEPLVVPFTFPAEFSLAAEGCYSLIASVKGVAIKSVPIAIRLQPQD